MHTLIVNFIYVCTSCNEQKSLLEIVEKHDKMTYTSGIESSRNASDEERKEMVIYGNGVDGGE